MGANQISNRLTHISLQPDVNLEHVNQVAQIKFWRVFSSFFQKKNLTILNIKFYGFFLNLKPSCMIVHNQSCKYMFRYVQPACATTGDGLYEGLTWLTTNHKS